MTGPTEHAGDRLLVHLTRFARALRRVGFPLGPEKLMRATRAVQAVGIGRRQDFYWTLHAVFVNQPDQRDLFDEVFYLFWREPGALDGSFDGLPPEQDGARKLSRRVVEALLQDRDSAGASERPASVEIDARLSWSRKERFKTKDFEQMSAEELAEAQAAVRAMALPVKTVPSRRFRPHPRGTRVDMHKTLRASLRFGPDTISLVRGRRRDRPPSFVMLCDISGSMATYTRVFLHFAHGMTQRYRQVSTFLFATRLTNVTRRLRDRDVDRALDSAGRLARDWDGGTRIGRCLHEFNRDWSRRVLAQSHWVLLLSDGLDRDAGEGLTHEMERLRKSCRRLIWLNPLLRYDEFQPLAAGIRTILPHVDEFRSIHNLESVRALTDALAMARHRQPPGGRAGALQRYAAKGV